MAQPLRSNAATPDVPQSGDSLEILCSKLTTIANVITAGESVAVATGYSAAASQERRSVQKAISQMHPLEREMWAQFETNPCVLPDIDWKTDIDSTPLSQKPLKTARRRAEALN
jgi:hypothetical protein